MKNLYKIFLICTVIITSFTSCEESDNTIDTLYDNVDLTGALVRTLIEPLELVTLTNETNNFISMSLEIQEGNGSIPSTLKELRVYVATYNDQDQEQVTLDEDGNPISETLLSTIPAADFVPSEVNNLPSTDIFILTQAIVDLNPSAVYTFPTFIYVRLEVELEDGRTFSDQDAGPSVAAGNYFLSPFYYNIIFLPN